MNTMNPALIGQIEKMLNLLLHRSLQGTGLTEEEWVTLRIADHLALAHVEDGLAASVQDRAGLDDASVLVAGLEQCGYLENDRVSGPGREVVDAIQGRIEAATVPLWAGLDDGDIEVANRVLRVVLNNARAELGREPLGPPRR